MNTTLRDALAEMIDGVGPAQPDVSELISLGEQRLRRRRLTVVASAAAAVVVVIALVAGTAFHGPIKRSDGPVDHPTSSPGPPQQPVRSIVYSDIHWDSASGPDGTVHLGDQVVQTGAGFVHMDVTDDGFVYTNDARAWFSDGGTPRQIGSHLCSALPNGEFSHYAHRSVMTANAGSLAAWFDCTRPTRPALVVFDTTSRREIVHRPMTLCRVPASESFPPCELVDVTADHVYFNHGGYVGFPRAEYSFDLRDQRLRSSTPRAHAADLRRHRRGLVLGSTWQTGTPTNGIGQSFSAVGSRLVPQRNDASDSHLASAAFDTSTGRALRLRLPDGYRAERNDFTLFEWLDDDTVALVNSGGWRTGDILTCQLSSGRCIVAVGAPKDVERRGNPDGTGGVARIVPYFPLPG